jgi:hypothetical protein
MIDCSLGAQRLFEEMQQLDPHEEARRELRAAGVNEARIESLYPSGFDGIASGLIERIEGLPDSAFNRLGSFSSSTREVVNAVQNVKSGPLTLQTYVYLELAADCEIESASDGWKQIENWLIKRGVGSAGAVEFNANRIAEVLWCTYTFMVRRETFRPEHKAIADEVMLNVGVALGLLKVEEDDDLLLLAAVGHFAE